MAKSKAEAWASKPIKERAKLYLDMRKHLREVADLVVDGVPGESQALHHTARSFGSVAARLHRQIEMDKASCCNEAQMFGSCTCGVAA